MVHSHCSPCSQSNNITQTSQNYWKKKNIISPSKKRHITTKNKTHKCYLQQPTTDNQPSTPLTRTLLFLNKHQLFHQNKKHTFKLSLQLYLGHTSTPLPHHLNNNQSLTNNPIQHKYNNHIIKQKQKNDQHEHHNLLLLKISTNKHHFLL